jgi:Ca2+-binding RTX toxin-like protein
LAFTTTVGAGGTSLLGTSGVDTTTFAPGTLATAVFIGAEGDTDFVTLQTNQASAYTIFGGQGVDTITVAGLKNSLLKGDDGNDVITINTNALQSSTVSGLEGNDEIFVESNVNGALVNGNNGNDIIDGTAVAITFTNNGKVVGGQGNDDISVGDAGVEVTLTSGLINGQDGDDTITVRANDMVFGGGATVFGGQGSDVITANGGGNVVLSGDLGADNIAAAAGADTIFGGDGNDRITAGNDSDSVTGGEGIDTFASGIGTSTASTAQNASYNSAAIVAGASLSFGDGVDIITDFAAGSNGDIFSNGNGITAATIIETGDAVNAAALTVNDTFALSGNFSNGVFTVAANNSGSATMIITGNGVALDASVGITILTGVNIGQLVAANFA